MKRIIVISIFVFAGLTSFSQNIQLHYDFLKDRNYLTSTIEFFKSDKIGSTFFIVDMDYAADKGGMSMGYLEIARTFKFGSFPIEAHVEYDGGLMLNSTIGVNFDNAYLLGGTYNTNVGKFSISTSVMYKGFANAKKGPDLQLTGTWFGMFANNKLTFTGFIDFWSQDNKTRTEKKFILLAEPQLWYNINEKFSVGSELELSNNFVNESDFDVYPTIGVKWNF